MKKTINIAFFTLLFLLIIIKSADAASNITYFYAEPIKIEDENIDIISNELVIDTTTSIITNEFLIENTSMDEVKIKIIFPIENKEFSISVNGLEILLDDTKVEYTVNEDGSFVVNTKIKGNYGKKIQIRYKTDNDLLKAKVIKYGMQNFGNRIVGKVKVDIKLLEKDIPLVQGIYPGHFTFQDNTISVEYYNYMVAPS